MSIGRLVSASILVPVASLLILSGCGSSGDGATADSAVPPQTFAAEADSICSKGQARGEAEFKAFFKEKGIKEIGEKGQSPAETKALETEVIETVGIPALRRQLEELRALGVPQGKEETAEEFFDTIEEELKEAESEPRSLFKQTSVIFAKSDQLAQELGFEVCGNH